MRKAFFAVGILMGLLALTACGRANGQTVYKYSETAVFSDGFQIKKTVYMPGEMNLYYSGAELNDQELRCYGADFADLGDEFEYTYKNGVLTVKAEFAEKISGIVINDAENCVIYHLRYLDSSQFAWLAEVLWLDDGWQEMGDAEKYYTAEELQAQAEQMEAERRETLDTFALLDGTWVSEDGTRSYAFTLQEDSTYIFVEETQFDEEPAQPEWIFSAEAAHQSEYFDDDGEETRLLEITLASSDHSAADMCILYDPQNHFLQVGDTICRRKKKE